MGERMTSLKPRLSIPSNVRVVLESATALITLAMIITLTASVIILTHPLHFGSTLVFQDLAAVGTFVAAGAAWLSALVNIRLTRRSVPKSSSSSSNGMTDSEYRFMNEFMNRIARGDLEGEKVDHILAALRTFQENNKRFEKIDFPEPRL
jgi:hypothetical protein